MPSPNSTRCESLRHNMARYADVRPEEVTCLASREDGRRLSEGHYLLLFTLMP